MIETTSFDDDTIDNHNYFSLSPSLCIGHGTHIVHGHESRGPVPPFSHSISRDSVNCGSITNHLNQLLHTFNAISAIYPHNATANDTIHWHWILDISTYSILNSHKPQTHTSSLSHSLCGIIIKFRGKKAPKAATANFDGQQTRRIGIKLRSPIRLSVAGFWRSVVGAWKAYSLFYIWTRISDWTRRIWCLNGQQTTK